MGYNPRPPQKAGDFHNSKAFEQLVGSWLPDEKTDKTSSTSEMDWIVGDIRVEVKEKNQKYNASNWVFPKDSEEKNVFIIDELSVMKALYHFPSVYFVLRDNVEGSDRCFLAPIAYIVACNRETVDRIGRTKYAKGKWVCNLLQFTELSDPATQLWPMIQQYETEKPWLKSACLLPNH